MADAFELPLTADGDRTFQCNLGGTVFSFRSYYVKGINSFWSLDVYTAELEPLAVGRRLIAGSINLFKGFGNELGTLAATVLLDENTDADESADDAPGATLRLFWFPSVGELPFSDGDPMDTLYDQFAIAQDYA